MKLKLTPNVVDVYWIALIATLMTIIISPLLHTLLEDKLSNETVFLLTLATSNALPSIAYAIHTFILAYRSGFVLLIVSVIVYLVCTLLLIIKARRMLWYGFIGLCELTVLIIWRAVWYGYG